MNAESASSPVVFPLLANAAEYRACETDLLRDERARIHWLRVFEDQLPMQLAAARACGASEEQVASAREQFLADLRELRANPGCHGRLDILLLDQLRQRAFRTNGIADEMKLIKDRENEAALAAFSARLEHVSAIADSHERLLDIVCGMLAGNLFDMGVEATAAKFADGTVPFAESLAMVPPRPWLVDDFDAASGHLETSGVSKAVVFVDNAGGDLILGLMPLVRELLNRGAEVVLTANLAPAHNDVTHDELVALLPRLVDVDAAFASPKLRLVPSGNDAPLIDLRRISRELAEAALGADLCVLLGMGRALETNFSARFICPTMKVAMVKDPEVARALGGTVYDAVCGFGR
jgi:uncharacterized protein with ATP-grasp and redox domains